MQKDEKIIHPKEIKNFLPYEQGMKEKILRVTVTEDYYIKMHDEEKSQINGWTIKEVIKDWFKRPLDSYHATRNNHKIGGSKKLLNVEVIDGEDYESSL